MTDTPTGWKCPGWQHKTRPDWTEGGDHYSIIVRTLPARRPLAICPMTLPDWYGRSTRPSPPWVLTQGQHQ